MQIIIGKIFFYNMLLVAAANNKVIKPIGGIRLHYVPKDRLSANFDHVLDIYKNIKNQVKNIDNIDFDKLLHDIFKEAGAEEYYDEFITNNDDINLDKISDCFSDYIKLLNNEGHLKKNYNFKKSKIGEGTQYSISANIDVFANDFEECFKPAFPNDFYSDGYDDYTDSDDYSYEDKTTLKIAYTVSDGYLTDISMNVRNRWSYQGATEEYTSKVSIQLTNIGNCGIDNAGLQKIYNKYKDEIIETGDVFSGIPRYLEPKYSEAYESWDTPGYDEWNNWDTSEEYINQYVY